MFGAFLLFAIAVVDNCTCGCWVVSLSLRWQCLQFALAAVPAEQWQCCRGRQAASLAATTTHLQPITPLPIVQASQVARNVTTNELANWHRCATLHGCSPPSPAACCCSCTRKATCKYSLAADAAAHLPPSATPPFDNRPTDPSVRRLTGYARPTQQPHCAPVSPAPCRRYKYMHGPEGDFQNPFDRGWRRNCVDTCKPTAAPASPFVLRCAAMCRLAGVEVLGRVGWVPEVV